MEYQQLTIYTARRWKAISFICWWFVLTLSLLYRGVEGEHWKVNKFHLWGENLQKTIFQIVEGRDTYQVLKLKTYFPYLNYTMEAVAQNLIIRSINIKQTRVNYIPGLILNWLVTLFTHMWPWYLLQYNGNLIVLICLKIRTDKNY